MISIRDFVDRYLDPAERFEEILFGLIMALGFTGAVRLGREDSDNLTLFTRIFGCNIAWAIVDGVMFVLTALFERGRQSRAVRDVLKAPNDKTALHRVAKELDNSLWSLMTPEERLQIHRMVLEHLRRSPLGKTRVRREDLLGGAAVGLIIFLATLPVVIPFLVFPDPNFAVRVSNFVALLQVFLLGFQWGRIVGGRALRIATGLTMVGVVLVLITIVLGG